MKDWRYLRGTRGPDGQWLIDGERPEDVLTPDQLAAWHEANPPHIDADVPQKQSSWAMTAGDDPQTGQDRVERLALRGKGAGEGKGEGEGESKGKGKGKGKRRGRSLDQRTASIILAVAADWRARGKPIGYAVRSPFVRHVHRLLAERRITMAERQIEAPRRREQITMAERQIEAARKGVPGPEIERTRAFVRQLHDQGLI